MAEGAGEKQTPERAPLRSFEAYKEAVERGLKEGSRLPEIELEASPDERNSDVHIRLFHTGTERFDRGYRASVGGIWLAVDEAKGTAYIRNIDMGQYWREHDELRFGYAAYLELIKYLLSRTPPLRLTSGNMLSRGAHGVWEGFVRMGIARMTEKGVIDERAYNRGYSTAKYELL